jgi:hypothetical protein
MGRLFRGQRCGPLVIRGAATALRYAIAAIPIAEHARTSNVAIAAAA